MHKNNSARTVLLLLLQVAYMLSGISTATASRELMSHGHPVQAASANIAGDTLQMAHDSLSTETPKVRIKRAGNWIKRFVRSFDDYDTNYIAPNYYNYTAMLQNTNFYQLYFLQGTDASGHRQILQISPSPSFKIGPYFGWRWLFLGYTFDVIHPRAAVKTTEFNLSLYSSMLGFDFVRISNTGDFTIQRVTGFSDNISEAVKKKEFSGMDAYTLGANVYYVFNHRHFSYPAAYAQSTVQRKSCGSWMLGLSYSKQRINFDYTKLPSPLITPETSEDGTTPLIDELKISQIDYSSFSVSGGYAYNWVPRRNCLLSISMMPSIGFKRAHGERLSGQSIWLNVRNLNFDFVGRAGFVWNNTRYFAGISAVTHLYDYQKDSYSMKNLINYINVYAGFTFNKKRQYRNRK